MNTNGKKIFEIGALIIFFLIIIIYAFFRSHDLIFGVKIKDVSMNGQPIVSGTKVTNNILELNGNAKNAVHVILDGREISVDQQGNFHETIALLAGYNIITIQAE